MDNQIDWKKIKLVICDIDNTLIVKHKTLTKRAKAVIQQLQKQGIYFGIASGRSLPEIRRMIHAWGYDDFDLLISLNGSVLWNGLQKKQYDYFKLEKQRLKEILEFMAPFENNPLIYRNDTILCKHMDDVVALSAKTAQMQAYEALHMEEFYQEDNAKIMFRVEACDMEQIEAYVNLHPSPYFHAFKTQSTLLEFSDKRVSKAYALEKFCTMQGFRCNQVVAFGDTTNDNSMLEIAGVGVCMSNGSEDTKAIADMVSEVACDEDGWADFMEHQMAIMKGISHET